MNNGGRTFGFRAGLNDSILDTSITLTTSSGDSITKREFTIKTFLLLLFGGILLMALEATTVIGRGGISSICFGIVFCWLVWEVSQPTNANRIAISYVPVLFKYARKENRRVSFRSYSPSYAISLLTDIADNGVSDRGMIRFVNNDLGRVFEITGTASRLMFESDKKRVVDDARNFYRNINPLTTVVIDTLSSPQRVKSQLLAKDYQLNHMALKDENLRKLVEHERQYLADTVGHSFPMYHQYFVVRSVNEDEMNIFIDWLMQIMSNSSLYLKDIRPLDDRDQVIDYLHGLYAADDDILDPNIHD